MPAKSEAHCPRCAEFARLNLVNSSENWVLSALSSRTLSKVEVLSALAPVPFARQCGGVQNKNGIRLGYVIAYIIFIFY